MAVFEDKNLELEKLRDGFKRLEKLISNPTAKQKEITERQFRLIERFVSLPNTYGIVVSLGEEAKDKKPYATILYNGRLLDVGLPDDQKIMPGSTVKLSSQTQQIIESSDFLLAGPIAKVIKTENELQCEVDNQGKTILVYRGLFRKNSAGFQLEAGDKVVLDPSASIIVANLGKDPSRFRLAEAPNIVWEDIVGQDKAKESLKEAVELPYLNPEKFKRHNKKQITGIMLLGPPGNGKTMLVQASASALAKIHGDNALETGYHLINGPDILEELVGRSEKAIREVFESGEDHFEKHKYPAIIAIEEPDAVFIKRGTGKSSDVERALVTTLLTQMNSTRSIIILATNRPDILDPAIVRAKRINKNEYVGGPDQKSAAVVMARNLAGAPLTGTAEELGTYAAAEIFSGTRTLYEILRKKSEPYKFTYADIISYAEVADLAEKATSISFRRDIANNSDTSTGKDEILQAINESFEQKLHLDHSDALRTVAKSFGDDFAGYKELRQSKS